MGKSEELRKTAIGLSFYIAGSILGPMIFFGLIGYFIDSRQGTKPLYMLVSIAIAFVISNVLLVKKARLTIKETRSN